MGGTTLVTGGAGFVGHHLVRALLERGDDTVVLDLQPPPPVDLGPVPEPGRLVTVVGDVCDPSVVADVLADHDVRAIVHAAGVLGERESVASPRRYLRIDAEAVWDLCELVRHRPRIRRVVTLSSRSVYGAYGAEDGPMSEEAMPRPVAFYGLAKAAADMVLDRYRHQFGLDLVAARITGPYGPGQGRTTPAGEMLAAVAAGQPFRRPAGADDRYELVYIKDTIRGILALFDAPSLAHSVYNIGSGRLEALKDLAATLCRLDPGAVVEVGPGRADQVPRAAMSIERIRDELGFAPAWSLADGLGDALCAMKRLPARAGWATPPGT